MGDKMLVENGLGYEIYKSKNKFYIGIWNGITYERRSKSFDTRINARTSANRIVKRIK